MAKQPSASNTVGELNVRITGDNTGLKAALADSRRAMDQSGLGAGGVGGSGVAGGGAFIAGGAGGGRRGLFGQIGLLRRGLGLFGIAALATQVGHLSGWIRELVTHERSRMDARRELDEAFQLGDTEKLRAIITDIQNSIAGIEQGNAVDRVVAWLSGSGLAELKSLLAQANTLSNLNIRFQQTLRNKIANMELQQRLNDLVRQQLNEQRRFTRQMLEGIATAPSRVYFTPFGPR